MAFHSKCSALAATVGLLWLLCGLHQANGAAYLSLEPCPEDLSPGESWVPEGSHCERCDCHLSGQGYSCYSCGVAFLQPQPGCYTDKDSPDEPYPGCCEVKMFCPGDERFDPSKVTHGVVG